MAGPKGNEKATNARSRPLSNDNQKRSGSFDPNTQMSANDRAKIGVLKAIRNAMQDRGLLDLDTQIAADNIAQKTLRAQAMAAPNHSAIPDREQYVDLYMNGPGINRREMMDAIYNGEVPGNAILGFNEGASVPDLRESSDWDVRSGVPGKRVTNYGFEPLDNQQSAAELAARSPMPGNYSLYTSIDNALREAGFDALDWEKLRGKNSRNNEYQRSVVVPVRSDGEGRLQDYYDAFARGVENYAGNGIMRIMPDGSIELVDDPRVRSDSFMHSTKGNIMMSIRDAMKRQGLL